MLKNKPVIKSQISNIESRCTSCNNCVKDCDFLANYGNPGEIAKFYNEDKKGCFEIAYKCSLCSLCNARCPEKLDPSSMFLSMRREAVIEGYDLKKYSGILNYEKKGYSKKYSLYLIPDGCDTIFFPGCSLPGTRPETTKKTIESLLEKDPKTGVVLSCCTKPSHDLGREDFFHSVFDEMKECLIKQGVKNIIVACPNCYKIFSDYAKEFNTKTIYEVLSESPKLHDLNGKVSIHDSCVVRFENKIQISVRELTENLGLSTFEMIHSKKNTFCCGEGGSVGFTEPSLVKSWINKRAREADNQKVVTYCSGCSNMLSGKVDTVHILDLITDPDRAFQGNMKISKAPFTYFNRLSLKKSLEKTKNGNIRQSVDLKEKDKGSLAARFIVLSLIIAAVIGMRASGLSDYLDQDKLRDFIATYGNLAPLLFMLIYAIAPSLFLPGLPITIVGGILFGPVWGVVYSITGATTGAGIAFLISRYVSGSFIEAKLEGSKWDKLNDSVEKQGWKIVAITRLIPLFPFNLLNYAFGLTKIKFSHYIVSTFLFMLPACISLIVFSSSFLDLLKGKITIEFTIGLLLMIQVSLFPVIYRKFRKKGISIEKERI